VSFHIALNPALDAAALAAEFNTLGHVSIADFLEPASAAALHSAVCARDDWRWAINAGGNVYDLGPEARAAMADQQFEALDERIKLAARDGFQFRFSSIRIPDLSTMRRPVEDILHAFAEFMGSDAALSFLRAVTGRNQVVFADAQATAYHPGDFLTGHDDDIKGKSRELAYVMGLTPDWRFEWGGLLLFHGENGRVSGLAPRFNCLNLFALPTVHSVSQVTPFTGGVRYSVTGWLRTEIPDR
jgi:SM-20-related protein